MQRRPLLLVVMDGIGSTQATFGNAVRAARTPNLNWLRQYALATELLAHGTAVGMPTDSDMGNSEVGHNALGAGRIFDQGAKLVEKALESGAIFEGSAWQEALARLKDDRGTLHFLGLLSDGNVHSHERHLHQMIARAVQQGIKRIRIHALLDGRDVGEKSAEVYVDRLETVLAAARATGCDARVASGGGRMVTTMDRYEADWRIVERGWKAHVLGQASHQFPTLAAAIREFRNDPRMTDQNMPPFVVHEAGAARESGQIRDGDSVILFNFRGDRAIEITRAFSDDKFTAFDRGHRPSVFFAGMMQYDGDLNLPKNFLVAPPAIDKTLSETLVGQGIRQWACSETQKFGHVTYFWNGNRSGKFDDKLETFVEVPSDDGITFDVRPWMKAQEICELTEAQMRTKGFDFARINFANGDMVGHTGHFEATVLAVATVDLMVGRLMRTAEETGTALIVTADHGNSDEMFDAKESDFPNWQSLPERGVGGSKHPKPKTSHTLNPVPFYFWDPTAPKRYALTHPTRPNLGNVAATCLEILGLPSHKDYLPSLVKAP